MKIKLSKNQWAKMGKEAGWINDEINDLNPQEINSTLINPKSINWSEFDSEWEAVKTGAKLGEPVLQKMKEYAQSVAQDHTEGVMGSKKGNIINVNSLAKDIALHFNQPNLLEDEDSDLWSIVSFISNVWGSMEDKQIEMDVAGIDEEEPITIAPDELENETNPSLLPQATASTKIAKIVSVKLVEAKKGKAVNPWAVCTKSVGREDKDKYEKCVMDVKSKHPIKKD